MKKKIGIAIGILVGAAALGLGVYQTSASKMNPELSTDDIRKLVEDQYPGTITEMELEKEHGKTIYEVDIIGDGKKYDLKLDGDTGEVMRIKEKTVLNQGKSSGDGDSDDRIIMQPKQEDSSKTGNKAEGKDDKNSGEKSDGNKDNKNPAKSTVIDMKKAEKIALNEFAGTITDVSLDEDDGRMIYEMEIKADKKEAEIEIDAYTGEILVLSIETDDDDSD